MKRSMIICMVILVNFLQPILNVNGQNSELNFEGQSIMVIDGENGQILFQQNSDQLVEVGSITKLLTVYTALKAFENETKWNENTIIPISDAAYELSQNYDISNVPLRQDFEYTIYELVESIAVNLANGSALALADFIAGSEQEYIRMMETHLEEWGLTDFDLMNVTGLPKYIDRGPTNQFSAEVAATVAYHLINEFPEYVEYSQQPTSTFKPKTDDRIDMLNYNQMLAGKPYEFEGMLGLMPGFAQADGESMVAYAERDNFGVIGVVLGVEDEDQRYDETDRILEYIFSGYSEEKVVEKDQEASHVGSIFIQGGNLDRAPIVYAEDLNLVVPIIDTTPRLEYVFTPKEEMYNEEGLLISPLAKDAVVGCVSISGAGISVEYLPSAKGNKVDVIISEEVQQANWFQRTLQGLTNGIGDVWQSTRRFFLDLFN